MMEIKDCNFTGVKFDSPTIDVIEVIAAGLLENARALGVLANVFYASNIRIDSMLKIDTPSDDSPIKEWSA